MGCWNETCAVSNMHITAGQEVALFVIEQARYSDYGPYNPCLLPMYGEYDDYGGADNITGLGVGHIMQALQKTLVEMEQGENQYHDVPVKREGFDVEMFMNATHEGRLFTKYGEKKLQVHRVMIHKTMFNMILNEWQRETYYYNEEERFTSFKYTYNDAVKHIPDWISKVRELIADTPDYMVRVLDHQINTLESGTNHGSPGNLFAKSVWFSDSISNRTALLNPVGTIAEGIINGKEEELQEYLAELLKGFWVNSFMQYTRKFWMPQAGAGSQNNEHSGYRLLARAYDRMLDDENERWGVDDEGEDLEEE